MISKHIKKLEKIAKALQLVTDEFDKLMKESKDLDYDSNATFAINRLHAANSIIQNITEQIQYKNSKI